MSSILRTNTVSARIGERSAVPPLRVMRIITRLNVGGPSYQVIYLTQRLQGSDFDCYLLAGDVGPQEGNMERLAAQRDVKFTRVPGLGREISLGADGLTVYRLYREMRRLRPNIVHTHLAKAGTLGRLAARLARVPVVVHTYHGHVFHGYFSPRKTALFLRIERALARWTDRLVVLGEAQEREILDYGVGCPQQMARIPLGLELEAFLSAEQQRGALRRELVIPGEAPLVGIVARLVPIKAHHLFLQAACQVARELPESRFLIVGDGELREPLEQQALSLGMAVVSHQPGRAPVQRMSPPGVPRVPAIVHFLGFRGDLATIYADLDVVVLCSLNEGLPVTIIEALAAARPVVATEVGAVRDLVTHGETGWLAPSGDANTIADGVLRLLKDRSGAAAMGRRGRERVYPHLSIDRLERDIRELYLQLAELKGLRSSASSRSI